MLNNLNKLIKQMGVVGKCPSCQQNATEELWVRIKSSNYQDEICIDYCGYEFCKRRIERDYK